MHPLRCKHLSPFLTGFKFTTTGGASAVVDKGSNDFTSITCGAAGKAVASQAELGLFSRGPVVVGSPGANVAAGGFAMYDTLPGSGAITMELAGTAGSGDDGSGYVLALGFGNVDTDRFEDSQLVRSSINDPELLAWRITNSGTVAIASGGRQASVVRNSTGNVTLTLTPARANFRSGAAVPVSASCRAARVTAMTAESVTVETTNAAGTVQDADFILFILASGNSDESGRCRHGVRVPQLNPELIVGRVAASDGSPEITIGGATNGVDFTIVDNGVGDYTITLVSAFLRPVLVIPIAKDSRAQLLATPGSSSFKIGVFNAAGAAADDDFDFICLGYHADASQEF